MTTVTKAVSDKRAIKMKDGRTIGFGAKQKMLKVPSDDGRFVEFLFDNGESLKFDIDRVSVKTRSRLTQHGASQKIGDTAANLDTTAQYVDAVRDMIVQLYDDQWNAERTAGGGDVIFIRALVAVFGKSETETRETLKKLKPEERAGMKLHPPVAAKMRELEEQAAQDVDAEAVAKMFA